MASTHPNFPFSEAERLSLGQAVSELCAAGGDRESAIRQLKNQLQEFSRNNSHHRQAMGAWAAHFLKAFIPHLDSLSDCPDRAFGQLGKMLTDLPCEENSEAFEAARAQVDEAAVRPLQRERYLFLIQMAALLLELESAQAEKYLKELQPVLANGGGISCHTVLVRSLNARAEALAGRHLEEQNTWLDAILEACRLQSRQTACHFLSQWVISLGWIRPIRMRKDLLLTLLDHTQKENGQCRAQILFELFNLTDKAVSTGEKLDFLARLRKLPASLFTVSQLQSMYYFSGSIRSSVESAFLESVTDFQHSNYYIHRSWNRIDRINHFLSAHLSAEDYLTVQKSVERIVRELISLINIQSNAYVETLQSNYNKINDLYHQVEELSLRDSLTGLYNRRFLCNNIGELLQLAVRQQSPLSFVIIDIDDFKPINDTYGHQAGDLILNGMSALLRSYFRKSDFVIRYGGEEFLIIMFNTDQVQAEQTLESFRAKVNETAFTCAKLELKITVSVGIASCLITSPFTNLDLEKLIAEADAAMYESKAAGKNCITTRVLHY